MKILICLIGTVLFLVMQSASAESSTKNESLHFKKIMVVMFENMSYVEIKNEPTFKKLVEYSGHTLDTNGRLIKLASRQAKQDSFSNGYAFFANYYNNHTGGIAATRPSQPNYIALTSGSIQGIHDDDNHDLNVDNLAAELIEKNLSWKVYAEDLPDPKLYVSSTTTNNKLLKPFVSNPKMNEQENDDAERQYYKTLATTTLKNSRCFIDDEYPSSNGYERKHEPFISYVGIQNNFNNCKNIVNSSHLSTDINDMPLISFYIPNQYNDGHNGELHERIARANKFLSNMLGTDENTGEPLADAANAPFQKFMAQGGLLVITFDEPSVVGNPDRTIYTLIAGRSVNSGIYRPICYPNVNKQTEYAKDKNGAYDPARCNHYNLLKMIEANWKLRGLNPKDTSTGYKYAYTLDSDTPGLWKNRVK